jgi:hypothetical protein
MFRLQRGAAPLSGLLVLHRNKADRDPTGPRNYRGLGALGLSGFKFYYHLQGSLDVSSTENISLPNDINCV